MKKLGLDLGNKTLGIAISDELSYLARGLETFRFENRDFASALTYVEQLIAQNDIDEIILGYPKNMDGSVGEQGVISEQFKMDLEQRTSIKVILWDERLTSKMASNMMMDQKLRRKKRKTSIDTMAAVIILQGYLDRR